MTRDWRDDWVEISKHAAERWHQRTDSPGIGPRGAYIEGQPVAPQRFDADEVRHHAGSGTLLLRRGDQIVTVVEEEAIPIRPVAAGHQAEGSS